MSILSNLSNLSNLLFYLVGMWLQKLILISLLVSMFHYKNTEGEKQKHCGSDLKTLWERESAPSVFLK